MVLSGWRDSRCILSLRYFWPKMSLSPWPQCRSKSTCISAIASFPVAAMEDPDINKTQERCLFLKVHSSRPADRNREGREAWSNWSSPVPRQKTTMNTCIQQWVPLFFFIQSRMPCPRNSATHRQDGTKNKWKDLKRQIIRSWGNHPWRGLR